ncbi:Glycosyltransferase-like [Synechococcus sp. CC9605]|nr:Glycosyltransferase-like [Synechococcus sp. CC9605]
MMSYSAPRKIFWVVPSLNLNQASVRLRCLHIARGLEKNFGYENYFLTDIKKAKNQIEPESFLFIIKMPGLNIIDLLVKGKALNCKVIIDITDTVCDIHYKNNDFGINSWILNSLIDLTDAIFVPTAKMRDHLIKHAENSKLSIWRNKVYIIPDIAESMQDSLSLCEYKSETLKDKTAISIAENIKSSLGHTEGKTQIKRVLWFGNAYSPTSNMGISSLIPHLPAIKTLQNKQNFDLVICTNSNADLRTLKSFGIRYNLVEWTLPEIFKQLSLASMSLITTGDDERCMGKSNNRVLFSLINNCPVAVIKHPNNSEFELSVDRSLKSAIQKYLFSKNSKKERTKALNENKTILNRYTIIEITKVYNLVLQNIWLSSLASQEHYPTIPNEKDVVSIICDNLSVGNIKIIISLLNSFIPSYRVNYIHFTPLTENHINHYSSNQIIPHLLKLDDIEKARNFLKNNVSLVISDELNANISKKLFDWTNAINRFSSIATNSSTVSIIKQSSLKEFLIKYYTRSESTKHNNLSRVPENIPGRYQPLDISSSNTDLLFVCGIEAKNWILDGIAKEIGSRSQNSWSIFYCDKVPKHLPKAKNYFFMHQALLKKFVKLRLVDLSQGSNINCWYTHPRDEDKKSIDQFLDIFSKVNKIVFACSKNYDLWISRGLNPIRGCVVLGGFDSARFTAHDRKLSNTIGVCSSFYERKNPELLFNLVSKMRDKKFILLGKNWESYARYEALVGLGNVQYVTAKYEDYPDYYKKFKIFLSTSKLEGGPIPLMEAMACNCFPVVSETGFAKDIISHGSNGFLFETSSTANTVSELIEKAYIMDDIDVSSTVSEYSWDNFSENIYRVVGI